MKLKVRKSRDRGHANHDWLDSWHTFSFADYHDPEHMGFRSLRVINQDCVAPGAGFPMHPHSDMEIFSYVLEGELEHKDSMGNSRRLQPGEVQLMSAGSGVLHSEVNPSRQMTSQFLQVWIRPESIGLDPSYSEWQPDPESQHLDKVLIISSDGRDGSAVIHQDAEVWRLRLKEGEVTDFNVRPGRAIWLQVIKGNVEAAGVELLGGDAASSEDPGVLSIRSRNQSELLLFDLK